MLVARRLPIVVGSRLSTLFNKSVHIADRSCKHIELRSAVLRVFQHVVDDLVGFLNASLS